jgi:hypothetical protein
VYKEGGESIHEALVGFIAGCIGTAVVSIPQYYFFKRWGMLGVLEWHENQCLMAMILKNDPNRLIREGLMLHFLNGGLAALFYALFISWLDVLRALDTGILGILYGVLLWILTLAPIHKPITGVSITKHPLGYKPSILSLIMHLIYGVIVAYIVSLWLG